MTPNQGNNPNEPRGRQPTGAGQQTPPGRPQQPPERASQGQRGQPQKTPQPPRQGFQQSQQGGMGTPTQGRQTPQRQPQQPPGQSHQSPGGAQHTPMGTQQPPGQSQQPPGGAPPTQGPGMQQQQQMRPGQPTSVQLEPVTAEDIVQDDVVTVETETPVRSVTAEMAENDVGSVVVVEDDEPVDVLTDRKIALQLESNPDIAQQDAQDLIEGDLTTATPDMSIFDVLEMMSGEGIRRLPIVDEESGELQGIVTLDDVMYLLGEEIGRVAETVQAQSPRL